RSRRDQELAPLQAELREAMGEWGCPLCRLSDKAERSFIHSLSYERVLDLKTRDALKASRGLCREHTRAWEELQGSALGIAIVYHISVLDLLRDTEPEANESHSLFRRRSSATDAADRLSTSGPCPACEIVRGTVQRFGEILLADIEESEVQAALLACGGLCLPHLRTVLQLRGAEKAYVPLMRTQRKAWKRLMAELEEFIRKNDYRFADEVMTEAEGTSWRRVLDVLVGLRDAHRG
ncbi:MAG: DUF6062 family protein, partial [Anaerolineae bacterium]